MLGVITHERIIVKYPSLDTNLQPHRGFRAR